MKPRKITVFTGHYGSGKSSIAVNYAIHLKREYQKEVIIGDLDVVNPYFRTKDSAKRLSLSDIRVISPTYANTNVDLHSISGEMNVLFDALNAYTVIDLGGDERGALALGRYHDSIDIQDLNMWLVVNMYRPLSRTPEEVLTIKNEIEQASRIKCTGVVNNSNVGIETTPDDIMESLPYAKRICEVSGLPLVMTTVRTDLADKLPENIGNIFPLDLEEYQWL